MRKRTGSNLVLHNRRSPDEILLCKMLYLKRILGFMPFFRSLILTPEACDPFQLRAVCRVSDLGHSEVRLDLAPVQIEDLLSDITKTVVNKMANEIWFKPIIESK